LHPGASPDGKWPPSSLAFGQTDLPNVRGLELNTRRSFVLK